MAKRKNGLSSPRVVDPFGGEPLRFVETSAGWQVRGRGWSSTKFYDTKELAEWEFSYIDGLEPKFPHPIGNVSVSDPLLDGSPEDGAAQEAEAVKDSVQAMTEVLTG